MHFTKTRRGKGREGKGREGKGGGGACYHAIDIVSMMATGNRAKRTLL